MKQHPQIKLATSAAEIEQCFPVMSQLRLNLQADNFVWQVQQQIVAGYRLAYLYDVKVVGVAGFKIDTSLSWEKYLYLADLVVDESQRSLGYGERLFTWLVQHAKQNDVSNFTLILEYRDLAHTDFTSSRK